MKIYDKMLKPINEINYLRAENVERYRVIIRYFFNEYENINYWLFKEEIFEQMCETNLFDEYTLDKCQQDLNALVEWGNLTALQDSSYTTSIEDFKNRKYRYQISDYSVEIERLVIKLEHLNVEGASLEPTLLQRIRESIFKLKTMLHESDEDVYACFDSLSNDFKLLNHSYQDYIKMLSSAKAEELMKSTDFLMYKDKLIKYLRTFVKSLQENSLMIESYLNNISDEEIAIIINKSTNYIYNIPRLNSDATYDDFHQKINGQYKSIYKWFVGVNGINEVSRMYTITNDIIRKITFYAQQIAEFHNIGVNKKQEYAHIANIFLKCENINQAHELSSLVFGVDSCLHFKNIKDKSSDSIDDSIYDCDSELIKLESRTRKLTTKSVRKSIVDFEFEKNAHKIQLENEMENNKKLIEKLIVDGTIDFNNLGEIDSYTRKTILSWLNLAMSSVDKQAKNQFNQQFYIDDSDSDKYITIKCIDGNFTMPHFKIVFKNGGLL